MSEDQPKTTHRITNNDIDRRVGNLETAVGEHGDQLHEMRNQMSVFALKLEHNQTLTSSKFEQMFAMQSTLSEQVARAVDHIDTLKVTAAEQQADPSLTAAGRQMISAITEIREQSEQTRNEARATRDRVLLASGAISLLVLLMTIFGPLLQGALQVPS